MKAALGALVRAADRLNEGLGRLTAWLTLAMVVVGAANAILRYVGRFAGTSLGSNAYIELQWYLFAGVFLLGAADALRQDAHVRVDVFYARLSPRGRARIDLVGTLLFLVPFCLVGLWIALPAVEASWAVREGSPDPGGLPRYPLKTLVPVCFALVLLQGTAEIARRVAGSRAPGRSERA